MERLHRWVGCTWPLLLLLVSGCIRQIPVTEDLAASALRAAMGKQGCPYELGGRGPEAFDCSGLITWAYRQVVPELKFRVGRAAAPDANMTDLLAWNVTALSPGEVHPGDVVFLTDGSKPATHGGLVIDVTGEEVTFLNASSYHGWVVVDTWPLSGEMRRQRVVGFGRLLMVK